MKKYILLLVLASFFKIVKSQIVCLELEYEQKCTGLVNHVFDDYVYLRSNVFSFKGEKVVYSYVTLKRNVLYVFNVCEQNATDNMAIDLYNENDSLLATSIDTVNNKNNKIMTFYTTTGGRYLIATHFPKRKNACCLVMMGMITKNIEQYTKVTKKK